MGRHRRYSARPRPPPTNAVTAETNATVVGVFCRTQTQAALGSGKFSCGRTSSSGRISFFNLNRFRHRSRSRLQLGFQYGAKLIQIHRAIGRQTQPQLDVGRITRLMTRLTMDQLKSRHSLSNIRVKLKQVAVGGNKNLSRYAARLSASSCSYR